MKHATRLLKGNIPNPSRNPRLPTFYTMILQWGFLYIFFIDKWFTCMHAHVLYSLVALIVSMNELADCSISPLTFLILFEGGLIEWPIFLPIVEAVIHTLVLIVLSSLIVVTSFLQMVKWCDGSYSSSNDDCRHNCFRRDHQESLVFCIKRWLLYWTTGWLTCVSPRRIIVLLSNFMVLLQ